MDNNAINKLIFDTLSARKSILIEGVGTVVVARKGSNFSNPKKKGDFPHYELIINNSHSSVDLKGVIGDQERYKSWFASVCKTKGIGKIIIIPNCVEIRMKSYVIKSIVCSAELNLQLNPFMLTKKSGINSNIIIISLLIIMSAGAALYLILDFANKPYQPVEQKIIIPEKVAYIPQENDLFDFDTTEMIVDSVTDTVMITSVVENTAPKQVADPKQVTEGITEPIKGTSYMVVGSFRTINEAAVDKARLMKKYTDLAIHTTTKSKGGYINYIYTSSSYDEAMLMRDKLADQFPEIKGIWVYQYL